MPARGPILWGRTFAHLCLFAGLGGASAQAQIKHNDYTLTSSPFSTDKASAVFIRAGDLTGENSSNYNSRWTGKMPEINESLTSKEIKMATLDTKLSSVNGRMDDQTIWQKLFNKGDEKPLKMFTQPDTKRPNMVTSLQKDSPLNRYTNYDQWERPNGVSKYDNAYTLHTGVEPEPLDTIGEELSMQDINRYQFHSSNSSEPGLPITHAAGDSTEAQLDAGGLTKSPRLFDFVDGKTTSQVRSGGPVAPRVITGSGTRPYLPLKQGGGVAPTSLSGPVSSNPSPSPSASAPTSGPAPNLQPNGWYGKPKDGANTKVEYGPYKIWVEKNYAD